MAGQGRTIPLDDGPGGPTVPGVVDLVPIGRGGFGVVYRGRQPDMGRDVAVKLVSSPGTAGTAIERWRREVTAMGRLSNHPNIVAVYEGGVTDDGSPYLVMPFVPGGTLGDRIRREGPLAPAELAEVGAKLAGALVTAHEAGVLHRDLKPDNVLLSPYGEPQLTDFGIARLLDATTTSSGVVHASLPYAAPEVLSGQPSTPATDVYGLGATLFACCTGAPPFRTTEGEPLAALVARIATQPAPDLADAGVPAPLADVIARALAKDPAHRYPTAEELRRALEAAGRALAESEDLTRPVPAAPAGRSPRDQDPIAPLGPVPTTAVPVVPLPATPPSAPSDPTPAAVVPPEPPVAVPPRPAGRERGWPTREAARRDRDRSPSAVVLVAAVLAVLALAGGVLALTRGDGGRTDGEADAGAAATAPQDPPGTTEPAPAPTTSSTTTTTTTTTAARPTGRPPSAAAAASSYFAAIAGDDLGTAYGMLSPEFREVQTRTSFERFWGPRDVDVAGGPTVDEDEGTAVVSLDIDGRRQDFRLRLAQGDDGTWMIDGPRPR